MDRMGGNLADLVVSWSIDDIFVQNVTENSGRQKLCVMSDGAGGRHRHGRPSPTPAASFRLLFPSAKVGSVTGKAGKFVKAIYRDTGVSVCVADASPGSGDSIITVSGPRFQMRAIPLSPGSDVVEGSPAQAALVRVYERIWELGGGQAEAQCRLLAAAGHARALIGKAGKRIEKMRADTGARILVLPPALPSPADEIVQVMMEKSSNYKRE